MTVDLDAAIRLYTLAAKTLEGETGYMGGGVLAAQYNRIRAEAARLVATDADLAREFERLMPPVIQRVGAGDPNSLVSLLNEAQVGLRAVEGWLTGIVAAADHERRLQIEAAKQPPGFA